MEHTRKSSSTMTEHDRQMAAKLERITKDPEAYYVAARKAAGTAARGRFRLSFSTGMKSTMALCTDC